MTALAGSRTTGSALRRGSGLLLTVLVGAQFMISLDATIVNVALPSIKQDLGMGQTSLGWVVNGYALAFGGLLLLGARLGDVFGRRRMLFVGTVVFALSSLWCGLAGGPGQLVAARALQGVGAALMSPVAMAIVIATMDGQARNRALGLWGAMSGLAGGLGMLCGGLLSQLSWRWNFLVNVPISVVLLTVAVGSVPESKVPRNGRPDVLGALLSTAGLSLLVFAVVRTRETSWTAPSTLLMLACSAALLAGFAGWERRAADPVVPLRILRSRTVSVGNAVTALTGGVGQVTYYFVTLYVQQALGYRPLTSGLVFLPISAAIFLTSTRASALIRAIGLRRALVAGLALSAASLLWLSRAPADGHYAADILVPSVLWGLGWGLAQATSFIAPARGVRPDLAGVASGLIATTYRIGGAICLAAMITTAAARTAHVTPAGATAGVAALASGFRVAFLGGAALALLGLLLALLLPRLEPPEPAPVAASRAGDAQDQPAR